MKLIFLALSTAALLAGCASSSPGQGGDVYSSPGRPEPVYPPLPGTGIGVGIGAGGGRVGAGGGITFGW